MTAKKIAYRHIIPNSFYSACKLSIHFLFLKKIYIKADHRTQSLFCNSTKSPYVLNDERKMKAHSPCLSRTVKRVHRKALCPDARGSLVAAPLQAAGGVQAGSLTPGRHIRAAHTRTQCHLARLHTNEDNNEDNDDDK